VLGFLLSPWPALRVPSLVECARRGADDLGGCFDFTRTTPPFTPIAKGTRSNDNY